MSAKSILLDSRVPRIRYKDERTGKGKLTTNIYDRYPGCANPLLYRVAATYDVNPTGSYQSMSDFLTPGWHRLRREGKVFFNPMTSTVKTISAGSGSNPEFEQTTNTCTSPNTYKQKYKYLFENGASLGRYLSGYGFSIMPDGQHTPVVSSFSQWELDQAFTEATTSALADRGISDSNVWEALAELNKSAGLLNDILGNAIKVVRYKRGIIQRAKDSSSAYLAYRYGLKPVLMDIEAIRDGMIKTIGRVRKTSRGSAKLHKTSQSTAAGNFGGLCTYTSTYTVTETCIFRAMTLDEYQATFNDNIGLSGKNLVALPWELLPYSFVVDWVLNVGDFLQALIPMVNVNQLGSCVVRENHMVGHFELGNTTPISGYSTVTALSGSCDFHHVTKTRTLGLPMPGIAVKADFRLDNLTRCMDSLALLVQKLK